MLCSVVGTSQSSPVNFAEALSLLIFPWLRVGEMAEDLPVSGFWSCYNGSSQVYTFVLVTAIRQCCHGRYPMVRVLGENQTQKITSYHTESSS